MINVFTEATPNPATLKFLPGCPVMATGTANYASADMATGAPLALRLFGIDGVKGVFFGADFISVAKAEEADWRALEPIISDGIAAHFEAGEPAVITPEVPDAAAGGDEDDEVVAQIKELLDTRIRPSVAMDGGDIVFRGFERGVVYLSLQGACVGCPSSTATLKMGVENLLKHYVPDVLRVEAIE
jgi:Fe-S cluster biogenesis protein NfuA